jgi:hypothetical protein
LLIFLLSLRRLHFWQGGVEHGEGHEGRHTLRLKGTLLLHRQLELHRAVSNTRPIDKNSLGQEGGALQTVVLSDERIERHRGVRVAVLAFTQTERGADSALGEARERVHGGKHQI